MSPVTNGRVLFNTIPEDYPVPGPGTTTVYDTSETVDLENVPLNGGILIKVLILSVDPYMRGRFRAPNRRLRAAEIESYLPAFPLGKPLVGREIGVVLRSEAAGVEAGTHVHGLLAHQEYVIAPSLAALNLEMIERDPKLHWSVYIGAAGMPGETAKGEVAYISTGAGPVGSMVIQIAKQDGLKVIASAGSDEKVKFMKEIGDVAFNYKTTDVREVLAKDGPLDIFWDNVGGDQLDAAMEFAAKNARIIPMKNPGLIFAKCLHLHGLFVVCLRPKHAAAFHAEFAPRLVSGEFKFTEDVTKGLEKVGDMILAVQKGTNTGKAVVVVAEE
ncbi:hypothetical protein DFH08DRAFT_873867 [Mycena albidolilacea]|uniref:Enoyl reductase (ER) domain-containing protein n=1 Tax=Mycena albidolilacea TaxID=1033008 RepID=A0AAD7END9_9AGAR|nr:hypothetical protein DFH08DRAFT_873867 [Mycena albidolilacea]